MENAVDALKIAFAILVFVIALTLTISVIGQARATADVVFHFNDKTEFYQYATNDNVSNTEDRIVGIETVVPTIHRYAKEQYAVTIFDNQGNMIVRYDLWTEGFMSNWKQIVRNKTKDGSSEQQSYNEIKNRLQTIQDVACETLGISKKDIDIENVIGKLYKVKSNINSNITVAAPWIGDNDKIQERIKADMLEEQYTINSITYNPEMATKLKKYEGNKFIEKYLEITSSKTITDDGYSLETIKENKKLEIIYIVQE